MRQRTTKIYHRYEDVELVSYLLIATTIVKIEVGGRRKTRHYFTVVVIIGRDTDDMRKRRR